MMLFGLGTLPLMLGLSLSGEKLRQTMKGNWRPLLRGFSFLFALYLIVRGLELGIPVLSPVLSATGATAGVCY